MHGSDIYHLQCDQGGEAKVEEQGDGGHPHLQPPAGSTSQPGRNNFCFLLLVVEPVNLPQGVMVVNSEMMNCPTSDRGKSFRIGK